MWKTVTVALFEVLESVLGFNVDLDNDCAPAAFLYTTWVSSVAGTARAVEVLKHPMPKS